MFQFLVTLFSLFFSVQLMAQDQPNPPIPPNDDPIPTDIYLVSYDPKSPLSNPLPTDPADAGGLLIQVADRAGGAGDLLILADIRNETLDILDGRGVGLILAGDWRVVGGLILVLGDEQGKVDQPNFETDKISLTCEQALSLIEDSIDSDVIFVGFNSELSACQQLQSILVDLKFNYDKQPLRETETLL